MSLNSNEAVNKIVLHAFFKSKANIIVCSLSFLLFVLIYLYYSSINDYILFPHNKNTNIVTYTDKDIGGNSQVLNFTKTDSTIIYDFVLKDKSYVHYVGMSIYTGNWDLSDLSKYNRIKINMQSEGIKDIGVYLFTPNRFNKEIIEDICYFNNFTIQKSTHEYILNIDDFKIPNWWFDVSKRSQNEAIPIDLKNVHYLNIGNAFTTEINKKNRFIFYSISLARDNTNLLMLLVVFQILIFLILLGITIFKIKLKKQNKVLIEYKSIDIADKNFSTNKCIEYINNNYSDINLSLDDVSHKTGISKRKITEYLHKTYQCNFKTYVNNIRIEESKRLLINTELNIGEIADKVGYSTQSYFNYVFKNAEGVNPNSYRETKKGNV